MQGKSGYEIRSFDTEGVDLAARARAWTDALSEYLYGYDVQYPADFVQARYKGVAFGDFRAATVSCDPMHAVRSAVHIARSGRDGYLVLLPIRGRIVFAQRHREVTIEAGQFTVVSAAEPYASYQHGVLNSHVLFVPGHLMRGYKPDIDDFAVLDLPASSMHKFFVEHAFSVCRNILNLDAGNIDLAVDLFLGTLSTLLDCHVSEHGMRRKLVVH